MSHAGNKDFALTWRVKEYGNNMGATFKYYEDVDSWKTIMFYIRLP